MRQKIARGAYSVPGFGTGLPGSPLDGDLFILTDSVSAPTYQWLLRYVAAKASNKWVFIGGSPQIARVASLTTTSLANATWAALTSPVSITVAIAGVYEV